MKYYLNTNVFYVKGYKNSAIYDTKNNKVYSVDDYGRSIIEKLLAGERITLLDIEKEYIEELEKLELLSEKMNIMHDNLIEKPRPKLRYAWLEITEACNLRCIHCYGQFGYPIVDKNKILKTNEWKNIIDLLIKYGCREIQLIGGEPMAHPDFYEILDYAYKSGMNRIDVFTNATLINEKSIEILKKTKASVRVSVYGHNAEIHESITKHKGSFEANKRGLLLLKRNNIPTSIAVVIMKENEEYVNEIKEYILSLGHKYNGYDIIRPSCITDKKDHSVTNIKLLINRYNTKPEFWTNKNSFIENHFYNSCWNGKIAITSKGDILPCIFARDEVVGNIKHDSNTKLEEKIIEIWGMTKDNVETCRDCEYRYCCHDCRPLAKAINGNKDSKYPRCCYNPYTGVWEDLESYTKEIKKN